jgi:hypothetical protein
MLPQEFLVQFNVLYNNITSNQAPGLNAYEISLFLTKAEYEILKNYFNPAGNKYQAGYDGNQKRQIDFTQITEVRRITQFNDPVYDTRSNVRSVILPHNIWMIVNEKLCLFNILLRTSPHDVNLQNRHFHNRDYLI